MVGTFYFPAAYLKIAYIMAEKGKAAGKNAPVPVDEGRHSPQRELLEKSRNNPAMGRKPAGKDSKAKAVPEKTAKSPARKKAKSTATRELGSASVRAKEKIPRHQQLDSSGQDLNV